MSSTSRPKPPAPTMTTGRSLGSITSRHLVWRSSWTALPRSTRLCKRAIDLLLVSLALLPAALVLSICGIATRVSVGRGVVFRQRRAGLHGEPINVLKFRTMTNERDDHGALLPDADRLTPLGGAVSSQPRRTAAAVVGAAGDMSLMGPRPLPMAYVDRYTAEQRRRLDVARHHRLGPGERTQRPVVARQARPRRLVRRPRLATCSSSSILLRTIRSVVTRDGVSAEGHATMPEFMGET